MVAATDSRGSCPATSSSSRGVTLDDGRLAPTLLVGPFGIVAALETKVVVAEDLDWAIRDADRVRHWLTQNDQDFVVRVHAAVIGQPADVDRAPGCALITVEQVPAWLESLPPSAQPERGAPRPSREAGQAARLTRRGFGRW